MSRARSPGVLGGAVVLLVGALGFVPGVTTHFGALQLAHGSHALLFGMFRVSIVLNLIHVIVGAAAIMVGRTTGLALAALVLWLLGVFAAGAWLSLDTADNWLHFGISVVLLGLTALVRGENLADDLERDLGGRFPAEV